MTISSQIKKRLADIADTTAQSAIPPSNVPLEASPKSEKKEPSICGFGRSNCLYSFNSCLCGDDIRINGG